MTEIWASTLGKLALPLVGLGFLALASRRRGYGAKDLGLVRPSLVSVLRWLLLWFLWILAAEWLVVAFRLPQAAAWPQYETGVVLVRVLAIGLLGPIAEELLFRGFLHYRLLQAGLAAPQAVAMTAILWAAIHLRYGGPTMMLIFADGLLLGAARVRSRSVVVPMLLHIVGNLISIGQSLFGWHLAFASQVG